MGIVSNISVSGTLTVLASIALSIISSIVVNLWRINKEISKNRQAEIERGKESWYQRVISHGLRLRREALRLEYSEPVQLEGRTLTSDEEDLSKISALVESILELHTDAPPEIDRDILGDIQELGHWHDNVDSQNSQINTSVLKTEIQSRAEDLVEKAVDRSNRAEEPPY
jgi:hypothetical protein